MSRNCRKHPHHRTSLPRKALPKSGLPCIPNRWRTGKNAVFAICLKTDPATPVGAIGLEIERQQNLAELGYWVSEAQWGKGICTEAARAIIDYGFAELQLKKIYANHLARNPASGRVMEKAGMEQEGYFKSHFLKWGVYEDVVFYGIVSAEDPPSDSGQA